MGRLFSLLLCALLVHAEEFALTGARRDALERIRADSLRGHVSFLASDLLEGRATPSRGLDIAAEYVAAQFRRAGLEPGGDEGYFQTANWVTREMNPEGLEFTLETGERKLHAAVDHISMPSPGAVTLESAPVVKVKLDDPDSVTEELVRGKVVLAFRPDGQRRFREFARTRTRLRELGAALIISTVGVQGAEDTTLVDPNEPARSQVKTVIVTDADFVKFLEAAPVGAIDAKATVRIGGPIEKPAKLKNVIGILRGTDPAMADTCVLVSAHYDHVGIGRPQDGDRIYNGANDDASGTSALMELAAAFNGLQPHPRRSIVFAAWFGEERGLLGSKYYVRHPIFPLRKTVANVNLEHLGRTDTDDGKQVENFTLTGYDFSTVPDTMKAAATLAGVHVYKNEEKSDVFFDRSDNQAFADAGVPAHTIAVAFEFSDYHRPGDHWEKLDYPNFEKVTRAIGAGVLMLASSDEAPKWNESNPKAAKYVEAARQPK